MARADAAPLDDWVRSSAPRAVAYARSLLRDKHRAEDIVQDCYGRLLAKAGQYDLIADGTKLLMAAITNACINETQRQRPLLRLVTRDDGHEDPEDRRSRPPDEAIRESELHRAISAALDELPEQQRAAVELKSLGHSQREIAEMLGISETNAGVLIFRGRQKLADRLAAFLPGDKEAVS